MAIQEKGSACGIASFSGRINDVVALFLRGDGGPGILFLGTVVRDQAASNTPMKYPSFHGITFQVWNSSAWVPGCCETPWVKVNPTYSLTWGRPKAVQPVVFSEQPDMAGIPGRL